MRMASMHSRRADSLCLRMARSRNYPMLQKSPWRSCRIRIGNNRIGANGFLNQRCALAPDLESILRARVSKIVFQQHRPFADMGLAGFAERYWPDLPSSGEFENDGGRFCKVDRG